MPFTQYIRSKDDVVDGTGAMSNNREVGVTNRAELRFVEEAQTAFHFLVQELGFRLVKCEPPTFVRYESNELFLNVYHGRLSYEIDVEIGRILDPYQRRYWIADVLGAILSWEDKSRTYFQASNQKALRGCIQVIADLVATHDLPMLAGDLGVLDRVAAYASEKNAAYTRQLVEQPVRDAAHKAWRAKDYVRVRELYGSIRDSLTPVERKRLEYAEKHAAHPA